MKKGICALFILFSLIAFSQTEYKFRVWLKDKNGSPFSIVNPESFLSTKAIERRAKQDIRIDSTDLPVSETYLNQISKTGVKVISKSKWMNSIVVAVCDSNAMQLIRELPCVTKAEWVWQGVVGETQLSLRNESTEDQSNLTSLPNEYGYGFNQIKINNGNQLHQAGYRGEGMVIALIDAGFLNANAVPALKQVNILGTKDFVTPSNNVYNNDRHGEMVLSVMAAVDSFRFIGSAPKASYWLLRSEDSNSEFPVEEDNWAAAAEFADSVGVDIINTSLGYSTFDNASMNHTHEQLDGKSIFISRAAQKASDKGILVIASAGNEGNKPWEKINAPADARDVLTVGAINTSSQIAAFSSLGFAADNRVKPDIVAVGEGTYLIDQNGLLSTSNGTSFSAPLAAGLSACLWQALPSLTNREILDLIRRNSSFYRQPDVRYGYGVPNFMAAYQNSSLNYPPIASDNIDVFFKTPRGLCIKNLPQADSIYTTHLYTAWGQMALCENFTGTEKLLSTNRLPKGIYIVCIESKNFRYMTKVLK